MVDALELLYEEGRGKLRKAAGSRQQALYPRISEWGNPLWVFQSTFALNS